MDQDQHALGAAPGGEIAAHAPPGPLVGEGHASVPDLESALGTVFAAISHEADASFEKYADDVRPDAPPPTPVTLARRKRRVLLLPC